MKPTSETDVLDAVVAAVADETRLEIAGNGTKRGWGHEVVASEILDLSGLSGITLYEPSELVLTAKAGTPLRAVTAALDEQHQQLAFEPPDFGPLYGAAPDAGTIGGVVGCNLAGPRRIQTGAARDHLLGFRAVSGRGELFKSGGRVVKNVTGFDLSKLIAGSFGTLAAMTEVTVKVLPQPEKIRTLLIFGAGDADAVKAMSTALQSPYEVSAAAHLPAEQAGRSSVSYVSGSGGSVTAVRVEGPGPSVEARLAGLRQQLSGYGDLEELHSSNSRTLWAELRDVAPFLSGANDMIWRLSVPPMSGAEIIADLSLPLEFRHFYDWGGGLVWLSTPAGKLNAASRLRQAVMETGGHATLVRAPDADKRETDVFQPLSSGGGALTARLKDNFDPRRVLNPGRMYRDL